MGSEVNQVKGKNSRSVERFTQPVETLLSVPEQPFFWAPNPPLPITKPWVPFDLVGGGRCRFPFVSGISSFYAREDHLIVGSWDPLV